MFTKFIKKFGYTLGCLLAILTFTGLSVVSWLITCGLVYLIMLCFTLEFSWWIATGVWLVLLLFNLGSSK